MQTQFVRTKIKEHFGGESVPPRSALVVFDGFDQLDKEDAEDFFRGKSWAALFSYLHEIELSVMRGNAFMLEEWLVLEPDALSYYARAYLEYVVETSESEEPNEEFIARFLGVLYQLIYSGRYFLLSEPQRETFSTMVHCIAEDRSGSILNGEYVVSRAQFFLTELRARGGVYSTKDSAGIA
ncbi:MAG: hypothetical protein ACT4NL_13250 [Pseudomarimonas sp.]